MDIIKKLKKNRVFKFRECDTNHNEKSMLWEKIEESIGNERVNPLEDYWNMANWLKYAAAILIIFSASWGLINLNKKEVLSTHKEITPLIVKSVKNGEKLTVTLMDGSTVKLNSGSTLKYPEKFEKNLREVTLEGEAFFEINKNPDRPFVVKTRGISTSVLGTSFNINAYPENSDIQVAVVSGKVKVEESVDYPERKVVYLEPNSKVTYSENEHNLKVSAFDLEDVVGWKDGTIVFRNANESSVLDELRRWYGVDFNIPNKSPKKWDLTAKFENDNLEYVLSVISYTAHFEYKVENKTVTIKY